MRRNTTSRSNRIIEQNKFTYSPLGKVSEKQQQQKIKTSKQAKKQLRTREKAN